MQEWITVTIDGQTVSVPPGTTVLEAARMLGIEIPSLCYYAKLSKLGACRLCLIEVERMRGLQTACTTVVRPEMVVHTQTPEIIKARQGMLEFLLTNHPLDCPACDKGGECELQDLVFVHGPTQTRYIEERRHKQKAKPLGPTVIMDEERCVLCRRCVRYLEEWADEAQLDCMGRGAATHVSTFTGSSLAGKFVGNVVDLCPVGALTSRTSRFSARAWEFQNVPSICVQCGVGCNLTLAMKRDTLRRVTARANPAVNDEWLCDRGRFAIDHVHSKRRLTSPLIRRENGELGPATWKEALTLVSNRLTALVGEHGGDCLAALGSAAATNETNYLLQRFMRAGFGSNNIDYIGRLPLTAAPLDMKRIRQADLVVLCDVELAEEAPVVELLLRHEVWLRNVKRVAIGPKRPSLARSTDIWLSCLPAEQVAVLNALAALLVKTERGKKATGASELAEWVKSFTLKEVEKLTGVPAAALRQTTDLLAGSENPLIIYGPLAWKWPALMNAINNLALLLGAHTPVSVVWEANTRGALDMGVAPNLLPGRESLNNARVRERMGKAWRAKLPTKPGLDAEQMKAALHDGRLKALYIVHSNPAADAPGWEKVLKAGKAFVVVQDMFLTETAQLANVVLPCASFAETDGTMTNLTGCVQRLRRGVPLLDGARPDDQIIRDLAAHMGGDFGYASVEHVMREIARLVEPYEGAAYDQLSEAGYQLGGKMPGNNVVLKAAQAEYVALVHSEEYPFTLITGPLLYDGDELLQQTAALAGLIPEPYALLNPADARRLDIREGQKVKVTSRVGQLKLVARLTEDVRQGCVFAPLRAGDMLATIAVQDDVPVTRVRVSR